MVNISWKIRLEYVNMDDDWGTPILGNLHVIARSKLDNLDESSFTATVELSHQIFSCFNHVIKDIPLNKHMVR